MKTFSLLLAIAQLTFGSQAFAECHLGSNGHQYCGDHCAFNADGTWTCYDDDSTPDNRPIECHLGADGHQYCGHECAFNSDGTWTCD